MKEIPPIPIRIYREFTKQDWPELPEAAQDALTSFLVDLQKDPENRNILERAQRDAGGQIGFEFFPGFTIYWQIVRNESDAFGRGVRIEVLAVLKNETALSELATHDRPADSSRSDQSETTERAYSRRGSFGALAMWGTLHVSRRTGMPKGWIVDSWSQGGPPFLKPKMHWVSLPDHKLYHMQLNVDFKSTLEIFAEDTETESERLVFIQWMLKQWEQDWLEGESKKAS